MGARIRTPPGPVHCVRACGSPTLDAPARRTAQAAAFPTATAALSGCGWCVWALALHFHAEPWGLSGSPRQTEGLLVSRVAERHPEAGQWDVSMAIGGGAGAPAGGVTAGQRLWQAGVRALATTGIAATCTGSHTPGSCIDERWSRSGGPGPRSGPIRCNWTDARAAAPGACGTPHVRGTRAAGWSRATGSA
jgi:hypothetical protein